MKKGSRNSTADHSTHKKHPIQAYAWMAQDACRLFQNHRGMGWGRTYVGGGVRDKNREKGNWKNFS